VIRVLITGSRTWTHSSSIRCVLDLVTAAGGGITLVHGGAGRGADAIASGWGASRHHDGWPVRVERYPADWNRYGRRAGIVRNAEMVNAGANVVFGFVRDASPGTIHCLGIAMRAGIETHAYDWDERDLIVDNLLQGGVGA
jgi:hypothetical protein